jgi:hypothetical protein
MNAFGINSPHIHNYSVDGTTPKVVPYSKKHYIRTLERIRELGISSFGFRRSEVKYLPQLIHPDEELGGIVQGRSSSGHAMLAATDRRIIFLDTKPLFVKSEDISYFAVAGLSVEWIAWSGTLILHTRLGDFKFRVRDRRAAEIFRSYVELRCLEHQQPAMTQSV